MPSLHQGFFIASPSTDSGKTFVGCSLVEAFKQRGLPAVGLKPVAGACKVTSDGIYSEDVQCYLKHNSLPLPYEKINFFTLKHGVSFQTAAKKEGIGITTTDIYNKSMNTIQEVVLEQVHFVIVEGAGGWLVPINEKETTADLAKQFNFPTIFVASMNHGALSNNLATYQAMVNDGLTPAAWVATRTNAELPNEYYKDMLSVLEERFDCPLLAEIPYVSGQTPVQAAAYFKLDLII
ncbi:dethiobiotin synthase [Dongshaea marina]|uniref:dethiobiotin synthase n=1 Tax=Dongshaea marina TaxID=2047966 RepID=UPI000D3EB81A|nr:dethiobiotin synthase [Dongshaea marina]